MQTARLFKAMQNLVNKHVEAYQSDFGIDKDTIKNNPSEVLYYWYLRDCGTQLMSAKNMEWIESGAPKSAEFWLSSAKMIYEIHVDTQELKSITPAKMTKIIKAAKPMPLVVKIDYLINWMSQKSVQENGRPWEILYSITKDYKFSHWRVDELIRKCSGIKDILKALEDLKLGAMNDEKRGRGELA